MLTRHQKTFAAAVVVGIAVFLVLTALLNRPIQHKPVIGVTFSDKYAAELGLDWKQVYLALLDDLRVRRFRIPVYWNEVEAERGRYDWSNVDWQLDEAQKRGAEVVLVLGQKVPRWPECHIPGWAQHLTNKEREQRVLDLIGEEVRRFKSSPAVLRWQVENEPLFHFGECPPSDRAFLKREVAEVRALDSRPVMLTDSGELSSWARTAPLADVLGISLYRLVWNKYLGFLYWPVTPQYYSERIAFLRPLVKEVIISELQAEPWFSKAVADTPLDEQYRSMSPQLLRDNVEFAEKTDVGEIYLWGAEWWYWVRTKGNPAFWETARSLFP